MVTEENEALKNQINSAFTIITFSIFTFSGTLKFTGIYFYLSSYLFIIIGLIKLLVDFQDSLVKLKTEVYHPIIMFVIIFILCIITCVIVFFIVPPHKQLIDTKIFLYTASLSLTVTEICLCVYIFYRVNKKQSEKKHVHKVNFKLIINKEQSKKI